MVVALSILPAKTLTHSVIPTLTTNPKTLLLEQCKTIGDLHQIHAQLIKTGLLCHPTAVENLLETAALVLPNSIDYAFKVFHQIQHPKTAAFNIMIRGFTLNHLLQEALSIFQQMLVDPVEPNKYTFSCILKACSRLRSLEEGKQIHAQIVKSGQWSQGFVQNTLIHMYASCGKAEVARNVFDGIPDKGLITWNSMFAGYSKTEKWEAVLQLFHEMLGLGVAFDEITMISVLTACGRLGVLELGVWINDYVEANELKGNLNLVTSMVDMYAKCGDIDKARQLFDDMPCRDVVAWSAMISGYTQSNNCKEALSLFHEMQMDGVEPNEVTMVSVLASCAVMGALEMGKWVHSFIKRKRMEVTVNLGTALVDFYAKCGSIRDSIKVFEKMPRKNVLSWTVLIHGLASNGQGREALELFYSMLGANVHPNDVTFIGVLSACSHAGLVEEGRHVFSIMSSEYGIAPRIDHYGCMVDILSRAGLIHEAYQFIRRMHIEPNAVVWRTLLASCRVHKNIELGEESFRQIVRLEPGYSGDYILLSNIYASVGRWKDALRLRVQLKEMGIKKTPGCSLIEMDGMIHEFFAEDSEHPQSQEIYDKVEEIITRIKSAGYVPNIAEARLDAEEDEKEASVSHHSEKIAIAFGLIKSSPGAAIRVSKNLRVCTDCHSATKLISKVYKREIIVRDRSRFHHFKDGCCSCNDYW